jgi:CubicO group peptidase (beta-lactamase class C family)
VIKVTLGIRRTLRVRTPGRTVVVVAAAVALFAARGALGKAWTTFQGGGLPAVAMMIARPVVGASSPTVPWTTDLPQRHGLHPALLDSARSSAARTDALLVARGGQLVYEWYAPGVSRDAVPGTAALAKGAVGAMALLALVTDGVVGLDDTAARYIAAWRTHPVKSRITIRQLASHSSGLENVPFPPPEQAETFFEGLPAWKRTYYERPELRFDLALTVAQPVLEPGTAPRYSGIGYYAMAYSLAAALEGHADKDLRDYLDRRVYRPLGIPAGAWRLSYGQSYHRDGLTLYALGSGAEFSPRALARVGQLIGSGGVYDGRTVLAPRLVDELHCGQASQAVTHDPVPCLGWWSNATRAWPSLPRDAIAALGADDQVLLVVPSLDLVLVRVGKALSGVHGGSTAQDLDSLLFRPVRAAITSPVVAPSGSE